MQSLRRLLPVLAVVLMVFAGTMVVPLLFALLGPDDGLLDHVQAMAITFICGLALFIATRSRRSELQPRDGFLLVTLVWTVLPAFGTLPLLLHLPDLSFTDAYFEAVSGLTTTGATVLTGLEKLPTSINVWRCFMVLIGGMGILVLVVAILPLLGVGGSQLFRAESAGPMKDQKLTPRIAETARGLWTVYFTLALACFLAYRWAGMGWADAFMHMCSTMGLGGFAAYDASFGAFDSVAIEVVAIVFMLLAGINFALYFLVLKRRSLKPLWSDIEARSFFALMAGSVLLVALFLLAHGVYPDFATALRHAAFSVVSVATTTGFATVDYAQWPMFAPVLMLFLCGFATCAGSTGGGIKLIRSLVMLKAAKRDMTRIVHPRAVLPVKIGGTLVSNQVIFSVLAFMLIYGSVMVLATLLLLFSGLDIVSSFTAVVACINNTGPGLGQVGPSGNYQGLSDFQTWVCTITMLLGRLELLSVLVLFTPQFWRT
ncbi:TrkH family potassium uptake protein [Piscinibacter aquaticus]|uniref:Trk system potassium uptake protein n=1 Tax=Piscinibacter aquaticus TaxID=392597 RepID=A0A5C6U5A4_9BURK|nr:TrkH family potassium uptake protein [Piscinibacter aquaticus]